MKTKSEQIKSKVDAAWRTSERKPNNQELRIKAERLTKFQIAEEFREQREEIQAIAERGLSGEAN